MTQDIELPVCPGCNRIEKLSAFGCCRACERRVTVTLDRMDEEEKIKAQESPAQYHQSEQRFLDIIEVHSGYLAEMKRQKRKWIKPPGSWIAYDGKTLTRIIAGAQADLDALRAGLTQYRELRRAA